MVNQLTLLDIERFSDKLQVLVKVIAKRNWGNVAMIERIRHLVEEDKESFTTA